MNFNSLSLLLTAILYTSSQGFICCIGRDHGSIFVQCEVLKNSFNLLIPYTNDRVLTTTSVSEMCFIFKSRPSTLTLYTYQQTEIVLQWYNTGVTNNFSVIFIDSMHNSKVFVFASNNVIALWNTFLLFICVIPLSA